MTRAAPGGFMAVNPLEEQHFLGQLLDALPNPMFFKDERGHYLGCNRAFEQSFGYTSAYLLGKTVHDIAPPRWAAEYAAADRELFAHPGTQIFETRVRRMDGALREVLFYKATFLRTDGRPGGIVGVMMDITERKAAEREQLALEARLRQAQKMESIGHLCGGIAHDFNNILTAILGYAELCRLTGACGPSQRTAPFIDEIHLAACRARDLVAQLLAFSRADDAGGDPVIVPPIVQEVARLLRATFPAGIAIALAVPGAIPRVGVAPVQLHQILMNLGINARDAMGEQGRLTLSVAAEAIREARPCASCHQVFEGDFVCFSASDTGTGIPGEQLPKIFDPFFSTKAVGQGSGLGLSVLHGIVHAAGGHVEVDSVVGVGSTFRVYLPAVAGEVLPQRLPDAGPRVPPLTGCVLVVDDEGAIAACLSTLLRYAGCSVAVFTDPLLALACFQAAPGSFDLLVTDHGMPGLSGLELARQCLLTRPALPVILCSGQGTAADAAAARAAGIRCLLPKPLVASALADRVRELLRKAA